MKIITRSLFVLAVTGIQLTSCTGYGDKVNKDFVEIYYKDNISKEQAQQTLDLLHPSWNEQGTQKSVQLIKTGDTVYFRMVINEEKAKDIKDETFLLLANGISAPIFNGAPVNVDLTNNKFETIRTLRFQKMNTEKGTESYGPKFSEGNIDVYSKNGFSEEQSIQLAKFIDRLDGDTDDRKSFQAEKNDGNYIVNMVSSPELSATLPEKEFYDLAKVLSDSVFNSAPFILQLTDETFQPYRAFKHPK